MSQSSENNTDNASDKDTLMDIAKELERNDRDISARALRAIAARLATKPECPYEHSTVLCNKCGWLPNAKPAPASLMASDALAAQVADHVKAAKEPAVEPDTLEKVAEDLKASSWPAICERVIDNAVARLRTLAAKHDADLLYTQENSFAEGCNERKPSPQAAAVAEKLEAWSRSTFATCGPTVESVALKFLIQDVRALQTPQAAMPESVAELCRWADQQDAEDLTAAVRADYSMPAPAKDDARVAPTELQAAAIEMLTVIDEMETGELARRCNAARASLIKALEPK